MGRGKVYFLALAALAATACVDKKAVGCDPNDDACVIPPGKSNVCRKDTDCADGKCMPDGTCQSKQGHTMMLQEGQSKMMDGTVTMHPNEHPGYPKHRPKK